MNEDALSRDLNYILKTMFSYLEEKLSISFYEDFATYSKVLSINHNDYSICRLIIDSGFINDNGGGSAGLDKCSELLAGMLLHTLLIRHQTGAKQIENDK